MPKGKQTKKGKKVTECPSCGASLKQSISINRTRRRCVECGRTYVLITRKVVLERKVRPPCPVCGMYRGLIHNSNLSLRCGNCGKIYLIDWQSRAISDKIETF